MESLKPEAEYGRIPFDIFALEEWDHSQPRDTDAGQWSTLVKKYLTLQPLERKLYHDKAIENQEKARGRDQIRGEPHPLLTEHNIARVLQPHQTIQERNICAATWGMETPVWVRVCYEPTLEEQYQELKENWACEGDGMLGACVEEYFLLEDKALYDASPEYNRGVMLRAILTRLPSLSDFYPYPHKIEHQERGLKKLDEEERELENYQLVSASCKAEAFVYVLDAEAIQEELVKVMWLDAYGTNIWNNKILPDSMEGMRAMFTDGLTLLEAAETYCNFGNGENYD